MPTRKEFLKANQELLIETLEHIQNVTNIGLRVVQDEHRITVILPDENVKISNGDGTQIYRKQGARLKFTQHPNDGIQIGMERSPRNLDKNLLTEELIEVISPNELNREYIFKKVIFFLEKIQKDK